MLGVDAIIHVASPLPNAGTPQVILDVSGAHIWFQILILCLTSKKRLSSPLCQVLPGSSIRLSPLA